MTEENKKDLRIIKTQKLLKQSLLELFKTHSFNDITVTEICEKSMINRVTFYDHYNNKEELLNSIIEDIKEDIIKELRDDNLIYNFRKNYRKIIEKIINYFDNNKQYFNTSLVNYNNTLLFISLLHKILLGYLNEWLKDEENIVIQEFISGGLVSIIYHWIKEDKNIDKDILINNICKLLEKSLK